MGAHTISYTSTPPRAAWVRDTVGWVGVILSDGKVIHVRWVGDTVGRVGDTVGWDHTPRLQSANNINSPRCIHASDSITHAPS